MNKGYCFNTIEAKKALINPFVEQLFLFNDNERYNEKYMRSIKLGGRQFQVFGNKLIASSNRNLSTSVQIELFAKKTDLNRTNF